MFRRSPHVLMESHNPGIWGLFCDSGSLDSNSVLFLPGARSAEALCKCSEVLRHWRSNFYSSLYHKEGSHLHKKTLPKATASLRWWGIDLEPPQISGALTMAESRTSVPFCFFFPPGSWLLLTFRTNGMIKGSGGAYFSPRNGRQTQTQGAGKDTWQSLAFPCWGALIKRRANLFQSTISRLLWVTVMHPTHELCWPLEARKNAPRKECGTK